MSLSNLYRVFIAGIIVLIGNCIPSYAAVYDTVYATASAIVCSDATCPLTNSIRIASVTYQGVASTAEYTWQSSCPGTPDGVFYVRPALASTGCFQINGLPFVGYTSVVSVSALKAIGANSGKVGRVYLQSYLGGTVSGKPNTYGGGPWVWDSANTDTADEITIVQATGVSTGRWVKVWDHRNIDLTECGAPVNNTDDATTAIQACFDLTVTGNATLRVTGPCIAFQVLGHLSVNADITQPDGCGWWHTDVSMGYGTQVSGTTNWFSYPSLINGTIFYCTATSGACLTVKGNTNAPPGRSYFSNFLLVGPGTGTSIGVVLGGSGVGAERAFHGAWNRISINNFYKAWSLQFTEFMNFDNSEANACGAGGCVVVDDIQAAQLTFNNFRISNATVHAYYDPVGGDGITFNGGFAGGNASGVRSFEVNSADVSSGFKVNGVWIEHDINDSSCDIYLKNTAGAVITNNIDLKQGICFSGSNPGALVTGNIFNPDAPYAPVLSADGTVTAGTINVFSNCNVTSCTSNQAGVNVSDANGAFYYPVRQTAGGAASLASSLQVGPNPSAISANRIVSIGKTQNAMTIVQCNNPDTTNTDSRCGFYSDAGASEGVSEQQAGGDYLLYSTGRVAIASIAAFTNTNSPTCGTGCSSVTGNDQTFTITTDAGVTSVALNFGHTWPSAPRCTITGSSTAATLGITSVTTTVLTLGASGAYTGTINGFCN